MADAMPMMSPVQTAPVTAPGTRPGLVTAAGIIGIVYGCLIALVGLLVAFLGATIAALVKQFIGTDLGAIGAGIFLVLGLFIVVLGVLWALLGTQVLKGKNWARIVTLVFAALGALGGLASLGKGNGLFGLAVDIFLIVALVVPRSAAWFKAMAARPVA